MHEKSPPLPPAPLPARLCLTGPPAPAPAAGEAPPVAEEEEADSGSCLTEVPETDFSEGDGEDEADARLPALAA
jgi:hypothetical protein